MSNNRQQSEPGLPLRQFVRGFLRDHLGFSKILAHATADLFMKRWATAKEDGTKKRYAEEMDDRHTHAATFDRHAIARTDEMLGMNDKIKSDVQQGKGFDPKEIVESLKALDKELGFPDRPVFDPRSHHFSSGR